jgi:hypothetical protein
MSATDLSQPGADGGSVLDIPSHFVTGRAGQKRLVAGPAPAPPPRPAGRVPRVSRLLAIAIQYQGMVARGEIATFADVARANRVTRARMSQIMDLLQLAPDLQEAILFHPLVEREREAVAEHELRAVCRLPDWPSQRKAWDQLQRRRTRKDAERTTVGA